MKYIAAYLLSMLGGNAKPAKKDIKNILDSVSASSKDADIDAVLSKIGTGNIEEIIKVGEKQICASAPAAAPAAAAAAPAAAAKPEKEEKEEPAAPLALDDMFG